MASPLGKKVGARIRERRLAQGLPTQRHLAEKLGGSVTNQTVSDWERGVHAPGPKYQALLANALDVDVDYFYSPDLPAAAADNNDDTTKHLHRIEALLVEIRNAVIPEDEAGAADLGQHG